MIIAVEENGLYRLARKDGARVRFLKYETRFETENAALEYYEEQQALLPSDAEMARRFALFCVFGELIMIFLYWIADPVLKEYAIFNYGTVGICVAIGALAVFCYLMGREEKDEEPD